MKAVSIDSDPFNGGWRVSFDEPLMISGNVHYYVAIRDWLTENTCVSPVQSWRITSSVALTFTDHSDAMLCYVKFSAGIIE